MWKITDEKTIGNNRLFIVDHNTDELQGANVIIDGKVYKRNFVHGIKNAIAIICDENLPSFVGKTIIVGD